MKPLYTAEVLSTGIGRDGHVHSADGQIDADLTLPMEMGGSGAGLNPEQLFGAAYAASFNNSLHALAAQEGLTLENASVQAQVAVGTNDIGGYELGVLLQINLPGIDLDTATRLTDGAHQTCPYSTIMKGNLEVLLDIVDE
ncbi:Ohr family peroxiredoxin [Propionibacterium sp.]|uniref:Ohr family peroxiredoxin n=1 Tax=Propionibacterium sp. TaxID=1977903 RepID=UPI0039EA763E